MKPFNQITFTLSASGLWRCTMKLAVHDVTLIDNMTPEMFADQKRRFEESNFPVEVVNCHAFDTQLSTVPTSSAAR